MGRGGPDDKEWHDIGHECRLDFGSCRCSSARSVRPSPSSPATTFSELRDAGSRHRGARRKTASVSRHQRRRHGVCNASVQMSCSPLVAEHAHGVSWKHPGTRKETPAGEQRAEAKVASLVLSWERQSSRHTPLTSMLTATPMPILGNVPPSRPGQTGPRSLPP